MLVARGFTLTELMMALTISSAFFVSATSISVSHLKRQTVLQHKLALLEEISLIEQAISTELRRAGFISLPLTDYLLTPDKAKVFGSIEIDAFPGEASQSCFTFSYDKNKNGAQDSSSPAELLGFRLRDNTIEYRMAGRGCRQSGWQDLSTPGKLAVTNFSIDGPYPSTYGVFFEVALRAHSVASPSLQHQTRFRVDVANVPYL
ncbi:prepilin-type N-terminal cleavage/methylation domain-containing protein [Alteromonas sp. H39]|uniref:prepilin-type N-terminal cleavage/methylation domain-containing protein n=1 Tax=Alteromonas sp. H39 TaxID=3389876 RepID=UPI0039E06BBF